MTPLRLSDAQLAEIREAATIVPRDLRATYLEAVALELRGKDLTGADGFVHRIARESARTIVRSARRTAFG